MPLRWPYPADEFLHRNAFGIAAMLEAVMVKSNFQSGAS